MTHHLACLSSCHQRRCYGAGSCGLHRAARDPVLIGVLSALCIVSNIFRHPSLLAQQSAHQTPRPPKKQMSAPRPRSFGYGSQSLNTPNQPTTTVTNNHSLHHHTPSTVDKASSLICGYASFDIFFGPFLRVVLSTTPPPARRGIYPTGHRC